MCKKIPLTVLSGMLATLNPAEAKVSRCENENGQVTFSDSGCDRVNKVSDKNSIDRGSLLRLNEEEKQEQVNKVFFYCHKGVKKFTKC